MSKIEIEYQTRIDAMSIPEKMAISATMLKWARDMIAREILESNPAISDARLRWEVAMWQYGHEPQAKKLVQKMLDQIPG